MGRDARGLPQKTLTGAINIYSPGLLLQVFLNRSGIRNHLTDYRRNTDISCRAAGIEAITRCITMLFVEGELGVRFVPGADVISN